MEIVFFLDSAHHGFLIKPWYFPDLVQIAGLSEGLCVCMITAWYITFMVIFLDQC